MAWAITFLCVAVSLVTVLRFCLFVVEFIEERRRRRERDESTRRYIKLMIETLDGGSHATILPFKKDS